MAVAAEFVWRHGPKRILPAMARTKAATVTEYLAALPAERAAVVRSVRQFVRRHLPKGYTEMMSFGAISWVVPERRLPKTYNGQPLCYIALAAQKQSYSLYLMAAYMNPPNLALLKDGFARAGKKLDMGKSCVRFRQLDDLALDAVAAVVASTPMERYAAMYEASRAKR